MNIRRRSQNLAASVFGILAMLATLASSAPRSWQNAAADTDVSLGLTADRSTVKAGQTVTYTATMTNLGPDDATFVDVAFDLPSGMQVVSITCDQGISPDGPFCEYSSLPLGASVVSTIVATPQQTPARGRSVTATASILFENADAFDPDASNNAAAVKVKIIGRLP